MKAISIKQPWASLTAAGIRNIDISNRDTKYRGRVLLVSSARRVGRSFGNDAPIEQLCQLRNAQAIGLIPYDEEMPLSSAIGFAELTDCTSSPNDSIWTGEGNNWILSNTKVFNQPIPNISGKQGLFEVDAINEAELPAYHSPFKAQSSYHEGVFTLSMSQHEIDSFFHEIPLVLIVCDDLLAHPVFEDNNPEKPIRPISQIHLISEEGVTLRDIKRCTDGCDMLFGHAVRYIVFEWADTPQHEESEYERYRRMQIEQFEDDITEGRCYPEMPEGQFVRSK